MKKEIPFLYMYKYKNIIGIENSHKNKNGTAKRNIVEL